MSDDYPLLRRPDTSPVRWLDTHEGPVYRYRSPLRPITQLPLAQLDQVIDPKNLGPNVRELFTARPLTSQELAAYELESLE